MRTVVFRPPKCNLCRDAITGQLHPERICARLSSAATEHSHGPSRLYPLTFRKKCENDWAAVMAWQILQHSQVAPCDAAITAGIADHFWSVREQVRIPGQGEQDSGVIAKSVPG